MTVLHKSTNARSHVTMVYAFNGSNERQSLWANLSRLANNISGPWAIGGDFNCVLTEDERVGGSFSRQDAEDFRQCLHQCEVIDSPAMGALYTWNNKHCPADRVYSRLDRFLVNQEWLNDYPLMYAHFLPEGIFDHTPCVVQANATDEKRARPFKYFNMWSLAPNFKETVQAGWTCMQTGTKMYELAKKLKNRSGGSNNLNRSRNQKHYLEYTADDKAPGPDGYSSHFFKTSWDLVGGEMYVFAVHEFFRNGKMLKQLNATNVTLIPKVPNPLTVIQFRPIACCNVVYKCISKLLCARLALVLPHIISVTQGGFIQGRSIMENILICQDLVKLYGRKSVSPRCLFKIDLQKAYDSVE
ncbi:uncharacterized protein LOC141613986 [Silene latifolia]|uniref:uncharacterized protein LOC141613986 n=1 Tax=Silene latifolia TaxID=37657 RepID=UPI003D774ED8